MAINFDPNNTGLTSNKAEGGVFNSEGSGELASAVTYAGQALSAKSDAEAARDAAQVSETNAATSATNAASSETSAAGSATSASTSATNAALSEAEAESAEATAITKATEASASATAAATSETNAAGSATASASSATAAATSAAAASASETAAALSATTSTSSATASATSASEALASKDAAATSETNAATSETNAAGSAASAATSAATATTKATEAATSATSAASSATAATLSETNADSSASAAALSETNAATSESNAATSASSASTSATNASASAAAALASQTAAATSETNASTSAFDAAASATDASTAATNAATSETNAASSAASASTSATNAATSETNAATSATAAQTAQAAAEAAQAAINGSYLGTQTSDPALDLNGDPVTSGDWYFNTSTNVTRIYSGTQWENGAVSTSSFILQNGTTGSLQFTGGTGDQGKMSWNTEDETVDIIVSPNVTYQLGQEVGFTARNLSGATLINGTVVRVTGASGSKVTVDNANATGEVTSSSTFAVVTEDISNNSTGKITTEGLVRGLDTSSFTEGDAIWLSATDGQFTATKPATPNHLVHVGWVVRSHATEGTILVKINNGWELDEVHDVLITSISDNQILAWDAANSYWKNIDIPVSLPDQTGHTGKFLTTDGSTASWAEVDPTAVTMHSYEYTATSGQAIFSGSDLDGNTPSGMVNIRVYQNGIQLSTSDYTYTTTAVTLVTGAALDDEIVIVVFESFVVADTYSKSESDAKYLNKTTGGTMTGDIAHGDNVKAKFGASDDLQIWHSGTASHIKETGTGNLYIDAANSVNIRSSVDNEDMIKAVINAQVELYHNNAKKLATTSTGVDVTGTVTADGLTVDDGEVLVRSHNSTSNTSVPTIRFDDVDTSQAAGQKAGQILFESSDVSPNSNGVYAYINAQATNTSGTGNLYFGTGITNSAVNRLRIADTGDISFYEDTGTTAKFFWDASAERLGIGTSSPSSTLEVSKASGWHGIKVTSSGQSLSLLHSGTDASIENSANGPIRLYTNGSERARIDSSGKVGIGTTNPSGLLALKGNAGAGNAQLHITQQSANTPVVAYMTDASTKICDWQWYGTTCGSITVSATGTAVAYNTSSDYRLKEDWQAMSGATDRVKALKPINFAWKVDGSRVDGFLAHELAEVVPEAATGTKDAMRTEEYEISPALGEVFVPAVEASFIEVSPAVAYEPAYYDIDGNVIKPEVEAVAAVHEAVEAVAEQIISTDVEQPTELPEGQQWRETTPQVMGEREVPDYQGIDQSKLVPLLTAALQEALTEIESLKARVAALEV